MKYESLYSGTGTDGEDICKILQKRIVYVEVSVFPGMSWGILQGWKLELAEELKICRKIFISKMYIEANCNEVRTTLNKQ